MRTSCVIWITFCQVQAPLSLFQPYYYLMIGIIVNIVVGIDIIMTVGFVIETPLLVYYYYYYYYYYY